MIAGIKFMHQNRLKRFEGASLSKPVSMTNGNFDSFFTSCKHLEPWNESRICDLDSVVVCCYLQKGDKILALQRGKRDAQYQLWGIPGGKLSYQENPEEGLCREIFEETGAVIFPRDLTHLGSAFSKTSSDGRYGLHIYHATFPENENLPQINLNEHLAYRWLTISEFSDLNLLHAQREAFLYVISSVVKIIENFKIKGSYVE